MACDLLRSTIVERVSLYDLASTELLQAVGRTESVGARGGAIYDYLHLTVARHVDAERLVTLNTRHLHALAQSGDPIIAAP
jgi:predicted nucleic acid-binding protein